MQKNTCRPKRGKEGWVLSFFIIMGVLGIATAQTVLMQMANIGNNWNSYRCNPLFMPVASIFGHDNDSNFSNCVFSQQSGLMDGFLKPLSYITSLTGSVASGLAGGLGSTRKFLDKMRDQVGGLFANFFGFFSNLVIGFQKIINGVMNIVMKISGISVVLMHVLSTQAKLGKSIMDGPIGNMIRTVCFDPNTPVKMKDGTHIKMKNIKIGDILFKDQEVIATMKIKGTPADTFYKIFSNELGQYIYITGTHHIQHPETMQFIHVSEYEKSEKTNIYKKNLSCLVTKNNLIPIGEFLFWDWED